MTSVLSPLKNKINCPRYIEINLEGGLGNWCQLRISLDVGKFCKDYDTVIEASGNYHLEGEQTVERFENNVLRSCNSLRQQQEEFEYAKNRTIESMKRYFKEHGFTPSYFVNEIEACQQGAERCEALGRALIQALKVDKPFLDMIKTSKEETK